MGQQSLSSKIGGVSNRLVRSSLPFHHFLQISRAPPAARVNSTRTALAWVLCTMSELDTAFLCGDTKGNSFAVHCADVYNRVGGSKVEGYAIVLYVRALWFIRPLANFCGASLRHTVKQGPDDRHAVAYPHYLT